MKNTKIVTGIQTYTFTDENDEVFASFRINPMDVKLAARALEIGDYFQSLKEKPVESVQELEKLNNEMEEKISYVLGYDAAEIFGNVTATTVFPDGQVFAIIVVEKIIEAVQPALQERKVKLAETTEKYLKQYE